MTANRPTIAPIEPADLPLQRAYRWEKERANEIFLTQPMGRGEVRDWTWAQAMDEAPASQRGSRRRATSLVRASPS